MQEVPGLGRALQRTILCGAELGGVLRRVFLLHPEGRALPDGAVDVFPHQREEHGPVRAHADHRGGGQLLSAISKAARRRCATRTSCTRRSWSSIALDNAQIKYSTVQNWYPGDKEGKGGIYNFVTKRGDCRGANSQISWTQVETGSAITWKYPSLHPAGRQLGRRVLLGRAHQQLPAGRHRHQDDPHRQEHDARRSSPRASPPARGKTPIAGWSRSARARRTRATTRSATRCCSATSAARTRSPTSRSANPTAKVEHEASTSQDRRGPDLLSASSAASRPRTRSR